MSEQSMTALARGQQVRIDRAAERKRVRALPRLEGRALLADLLDDPPPHMTTARIAVVLQWPALQREAMSAHLLRLADVRSPARRVADLTVRQRSLIAAGLRSGKFRPSLSELGFVDHDEGAAA